MMTAAWVMVDPDTEKMRGWNMVAPNTKVKITVLNSVFGTVAGVNIMMMVVLHLRTTARVCGLTAGIGTIGRHTGLKAIIL